MEISSVYWMQILLNIMRKFSFACLLHNLVKDHKELQSITTGYCRHVVNRLRFPQPLPILSCTQLLVLATFLLFGYSLVFKSLSFLSNSFRKRSTSKLAVCFRFHSEMMSGNFHINAIHQLRLVTGHGHELTSERSRVLAGQREQDKRTGDRCNFYFPLFPYH